MYSYYNGYGEVLTSSHGFSQNQNMDPGNHNNNQGWTPDAPLPDHSYDDVEPGLYQSGTNYGTMLYSWQEMVDMGWINSMGIVAEEHKEDVVPFTLSKPEVKDLLEKSGAPAEKMERFDQIFDETAGENTAIMVPAIAETKKFAVKTPDVDIKINPDRLDLIETRIIEGRRCLVIAVEDNVEVNGMSVKMWEEKTTNK
jgi:hypothetical protein